MSWVVLVTVSIVGCDLPSRPIIEDAGKRSEGLLTDSVTVEPPAIDWQGSWQASFLYYRSGEPVGYNRISATSGADRQEGTLIALPPTAKLEMLRVDGREVSIWYDVEDVIQFQRGDATFVQTLEQVVREATSGAVRSFWNRLQVGPAETEATGVIDEKQLSVETLRGEKRQNRLVTWDANGGGTLAVMQSLRHKPMREGEVRRLKHLVPIKNELADVTLTAVSKTAVPWIDTTSRTLLEVTQVVRFGERTPSESVIWVDEAGEIQRTFTPALDLVSYRVEPGQVEQWINTQPRLAVASDEDQQLSPIAWVDVGGKSIPKPALVNRLAWVIKPLRDQSSSSLTFDPAPDQFFRTAKDGTTQLLVSRGGENVSQGFTAYESETTPGDLKPTALLNHTSREIRDLSQSILQNATLNDRDAALELARNINILLKRTDDVGSFNKASEVRVAAAGGSADHAILLAALLRSRKIPSRLALGLVYVPGEQPRMAFSVWTLAFVDGRWMALDGVLGKEAAADRIILKMSDTTSEIGQNLFIPIFQTMENMAMSVRGFATAAAK